MKHLRIVLSLLLALVLTAGMLAGCKNDPATENTTGQPDDTEAQISRQPVGSFVVNCGAILELVYNEDGLIIDATGKNSDGNAILDNDPAIFGVSCADAVVELVPHFATLKLSNNSSSAMLLKSAPGSKEPSETFLTDMVAAVQNAANALTLDLHIFALNAKDLNANGEMTATQAKDLLLTVLSIGEDDYLSLNVTNQPVLGSYAFQIAQKNVTEDYLVNALTGDIMEGSVDSSFFDGGEENLDVEIELPTEDQDLDIEIDFTDDAAE